MFDEDGVPTDDAVSTDAKVTGVTADSQSTPSAHDCTNSPTTPKLQRMNWARLLKRMGGWEMEVCPDCGAQLVVVGITLEAEAVMRALSVRDLGPQSQIDLSPARGPPLHGQLVLGFMIG